MNQILNSLRDSFKFIDTKDKRSKLAPLEFVSALVFSVGQSRVMSLSGLRRSVGGLSGTVLSRSSFWERLATQRLHRLLNQLIASLMRRLIAPVAVGRTLLDKLGVSGIYILDSTSITLPNRASTHFKGSRKNLPAALKWHALLDLVEGKVKWFELAPARIQDRNFFPSLDLFPKQSLLILDLGYYDYSLFSMLSDSGIYFLSRLKRHAVVTVDDVVIGISKKYRGKKSDVM